MINNKRDNKRRTALPWPKFLIISGLLIAAQILFITANYLGRESKNGKPATEPKILGVITPGENEPKEFEKPENFNRTGKILKIEANKISLESIYLLDMKIVQAVLTIRTDHNTKIQKRDLAQIFKSADSENAGVEMMEIKDLKIGDNVVVTAGENIKYKNDFLAEIIELRYDSSDKN
ncbi:MAG: hypothetical protein ABIH38_03040 [Patescibacteria group bacterium]